LQEGTDITLVTYGSCVRIALEGVKFLSERGISVELIDVQSLLPFDVHHAISASLKKTNRLVVMDEDVPGGATAFMLQHILEIQNGYQYLDSAPRTLTAWAGRCPYGTEGDYFTKPNADDVFDMVYEIMHESKPTKYPF
jgi:pyruvate/2-oxoglutarate/acetoin dehydrogenase E1 component